jgi:phenylacetate-CoA ligase
MSRIRPEQAARLSHDFGAFARAGTARVAPAGDELLQHWLAFFRSVAAEVPAYKQHLEAHGVAVERVDSWDAFRALPLTSKATYQQHFVLQDLCRHGQLDACDMLAFSSGSGSEPTVWPRFWTDEIPSSERFEQVLVDGFGLDRRSTLGVVCFALGNWVGGMYTLSCCRQLAAKGYPLTVAAPGNNKPEILRVLRALGSSFDQIVLFGYPPFIRDVIEAGTAEGYVWSGRPTRLVLAGEVFSEEWRRLVCERLGGSDPATATASLYGTADAGVLANETPLSVRIRRALAREPAAARELFGDARLPTLCQYDPRRRLFETVDGDLVFSSDGGIPLVRYKILDRGGVISYEDMLARLADLKVPLALGPEVTPGPQLPFVYVFGRGIFAVSFYGANVYPEHVAVGLEQPEFAPHLTGKFVVEVTEESHGPQLQVTVELAAEVPPPPTLAPALAHSVRRELERVNSEFHHYVPAQQRVPQISLLPQGNPEYFPVGLKHRYTR